jgi:hypothetical protein
MRVPLAVLLVSVPLLAVAGLLAPGGGTLQKSGAVTEDAAADLVFAEPMLIDALRAGGEPVIAATREGTIVVSGHPGFTHLRPSSDLLHVPVELVAPYAGQSYVWRSSDGGASWEHVGLPALPLGPRSASPGFSDPDLALTASDTLFHTDLFLAGASVSWSADQGATWLPGQALASGLGPVDRQWIASHGDSVYFTANYFTDHHLLRSDDGGLTWQELGNVPCGGDLLAAPDGTVYAGCGARLGVSTDGGETWTRKSVPGHSGGGLQEPTVDGAGNVWIAWVESSQRLFLAGSPDRGQSWPWVHELTPSVRTALGSATLSMVWPWVSAGSEGRVAVTTFASTAPPPVMGGDPEKAWNVVSVAVFGANAAMPDAAGYVLAADHHRGSICLQGTICQVGSLTGDATRDRRLGDFFETTIDRDGFLLVTYADSRQLPNDVVSHPAFVRQVDGPRFVVDGFFPVQG